jgi:hypothetical protein
MISPSAGYKDSFFMPPRMACQSSSYRARLSSGTKGKLLLDYVFRVTKDEEWVKQTWIFTKRLHILGSLLILGATFYDLETKDENAREI